MESEFLIGLDYGSESARGVLVNAATGELVSSHVHPYRHGIMKDALPSGAVLPPDWALQNASDYLEAALALLTALGRGRNIRGVGVGFTASSPMPARADGTPLSVFRPDEPHSYVKLWKHHASQPWADRINAQGGAYLGNFGGKLSSEWLLPKAAQFAEEAPGLWQETDRFIESGDWLVWRLTGQETRSVDFAAYKAQYSVEAGYPDVVPGLLPKLATPVPVGRPAGPLAQVWRDRCGIQGEAIVAVAVIDSHVTAPAVGATEAGTLLGALGTSAAYLLLDDQPRGVPWGVEGVARDGVLPGLWCYEAGQGAFGDALAWFVRTFPRADTPEESFARYDAEAAALRPGQSGLLALDWWSGSRAPLADSRLRGLFVGMSLKTEAAHLYRAVMESLCFGARRIFDRFCANGAPIRRVIMAGGIAEKNPLLLQIMADVCSWPIEVPEMTHAAAVGAAIHGGVAARVVADFAAGGRRYGARHCRSLKPDIAAAEVYRDLYARYLAFAENDLIRGTMHGLRA